MNRNENEMKDARLAIEKGDLVLASELYKKVLLENPLDSHANHNLGVIAMNIGRLYEAKELFTRALEIDSSIAQFWLSIIECNIKEGDFEELQSTIDKALKNGIENIAIEDALKKFGMEQQ
jgi:protein O-GlcNAc transferase